MDTVTDRLHAADPVLKVRGVTRRFGQRVALADIDLTLAVGELVAVIGPNGAGKTTLLSLVGGVIAPDTGVVEISDAGGVGWVPQHPAVYRKLTVRENLELFAGLEGITASDREAVVRRMLAQSGLTDRADDPLGTLSGGNQQRVNIAVALLSEPAVLLLDEPSSSLDPRQRARMWDVIADLTAAGTAVLFTTHDVAEAEHHADRVVVLVDGCIIFDGRPAELIARGTTADLSAGVGAEFERVFVTMLAEHDRDKAQIPGS